MRRRVMVVLGATLGPDGIGPHVPTGGLTLYTEHAREHPDWVDDCAGCVERRKDPPFAGYGPNTGGPAYFWQDEHGHGAWVDGRPPVPCGQWFEALDDRRAILAA